jgi:hypothetical protein
VSGGGTGAPSWGAEQALYGVHRCYLSHKGSHKPRALVLSHAHADAQIYNYARAFGRVSWRNCHPR